MAYHNGQVLLQIASIKEKMNAPADEVNTLVQRAFQKLNGPAVSASRKIPSTSTSISTTPGSCWITPIRQLPMGREGEPIRSRPSLKIRC